MEPDRGFNTKTLVHRAGYTGTIELELQNKKIGTISTKKLMRKRIMVKDRLTKFKQFVNDIVGTRSIDTLKKYWMILDLHQIG